MLRERAMSLLYYIVEKPLQKPTSIKKNNNAIFSFTYSTFIFLFYRNKYMRYRIPI